MATREQRQAELTRIYNRDKEVRASVVVAEAKRPKNPLHNEFEWDDAKAAHEHRLDTARRIIRVTRIVVAKNEPPQPLVHVRPVTIDTPTAVDASREGSYKPVKVVASDPDEYRRALAEAMTQLRGLERLVAELKKAAGKAPPLLAQLTDALAVARKTLALMSNTAA